MSTEERIEIFHKFMKGYITPELEMWLKVRGFFKAPASTKYHGNYEGGLFDHCLSVADHLVTLTKNNNLKWENSRSPYVVGMFHDLCKIDSYQHPIVAQSLDGKPVYDESAWEYNNDTILKGHGDKSVMLLSQFYTLTMEEIAAIRYHMGAFVEKEEWRDYTRAVNQFPNVLWTHHADMLASHVEGGVIMGLMNPPLPNLELLTYKAQQALAHDEAFLAALKAKMEANKYVSVDFDVTVFSQVWGSTCTGFDVCEDGSAAMGGCAMTKEYTTVIHEATTDCYCVFFGDRACYKVDNANEVFYEDLRNRNMASLSEAKNKY